MLIDNVPNKTFKIKAYGSCREIVYVNAIAITRDLVIVSLPHWPKERAYERSTGRSDRGGDWYRLCTKSIERTYRKMYNKQ